MSAASVIGRFAPSPTGDLHFGSLLAAVGSNLAAVSAGGQWLIRIDDLDPPREVAGSAQRILRDLKTMGLESSAPVFYQSSRTAAYEAAVNQLLKSGHAYYCGCTRKDLPASGIYPGTCRNGIAKGKNARSIRFRIEPQTISFRDKVRGVVEETMSRDSGDFIIKRADGLHAYHLAAVVDDHFQGVTQVVRGADLLDSTSKQICLQRALGFAPFEYMHLPLVMGKNGQKLSKRDGSDPIGSRQPGRCIELALQVLGQRPPTGMPLKELWGWALNHWDEQRVPQTTTIFDFKGLN